MAQGLKALATKPDDWTPDDGNRELTHWLFSDLQMHTVACIYTHNKCNFLKINIISPRVPLIDSTRVEGCLHHDL